MAKRKSITIQVEFTLEDWAQREFEERHGSEQPATEKELFSEVVECVENLFGGNLQAKQLNSGPLKLRCDHNSRTTRRGCSLPRGHRGRHRFEVGHYLVVPL